MEFRQLRYFLAVAEHLHFTDAATHLGIAQPPLSQQILKLEREIGAPLFIRHPRRVELTEAGRLFRERARRIIEDTQQAFVEVQNAGRGETGRLSLGFAGSTVFHPTVAITMQRYRHAYERVSISCEESNSSLLLDKVAERQLDAALVRMPLNCRDLVVEPLVDEDMLAVLPANHRLSRRRRINLADLADDPFILFPRPIGPDLYDSIIAACQEAGFAPSIGMESPQISSAANLVAAGFGVAVVPASIRQIQVENVSYHALQGNPLSTGIALIHRPREKSPTVLNFVRILRQQRAVARTR
ncbi:LysR family transcriptional regulator [Paraburkholderia bryophila]|uniref:DNA-binding transcriptional LysR family regulator n=1 Tax=Paraburkholderia bryophila TaxID=420952 RepID=A0A7Y9W770_9BURK|nr:LysR family transcriptional regulator [Paraburkholderia bryophila]NYH14828.1 DNA-binding transcriptional LysR family regulator [Paraburkholderia bryophila]NYH26855.1 DNA-binding transcriptional LysR family regulator [Paraburkholderia bryophila]